ncbi:unnamed protein product [Rotaria sordida]|uniref:Uncharacterized protein n=2 Tax=Rotaria sordida TaxID=392033 RepID=A0A819Z6M4_9BILA|nr:unnamed protein product [Rotaria sordida]
MDRQDNVLNLNQQAPRKKCHGNRRDQRFRRKCRAEKMKPAKIKKLIEKRNRFQKKNKEPTTNIESTKLNKELLASKQNYQSTSKKMKNISEIMDNNSIINRNNNDTNKHLNYRQPMYLTRS